MDKKLFGLALILSGLVIGVVSEWPDRRLRVIACDVGQGDAIVLIQGFTQVLVDGGPNSRVVSCLSENMAFWDRTIEVMVATHPDKDHITGLADVIDSYKVISFVSINKANTSNEFKDLKNKILENKIPTHIAKIGDSIIAGKIKLNVLWPEKSDNKILVWAEKGDDLGDNQTLGLSANNRGDDSTNDYSVVLKACFGEFDVLLTGDIGKDIEKRLVDEFDLSGIEVLKVAHHGSKYSTSKELLEELRPKVALIGVGKNSWGHPTEEVLINLREVDAEILRTDTMGEVGVVSDGKKFWIFD